MADNNCFLKVLAELSDAKYFKTNLSFDLVEQKGTIIVCCLQGWHNVENLFKTITLNPKHLTYHL